MLDILLGILLPFVGTTMGSAMVFFMKDKINSKLEKFLLGFSAGIMIAASIWSLLLPAINNSIQMNVPVWFPATLGLMLGFIFLHFTRNIFNKNAKNTQNERKKIMIFAVTLHNIPEGLAVGIAMSMAFFGEGEISFMSALMLSVGIAIQNFPEGAIISMPLKANGNSKSKSFWIGTVSGIVEPISAVIAFFITKIINSILSYILAFASGAMIYVVVSELIPESQESEYKNISTFGFFIGFIIMMILDIALG